MQDLSQNLINELTKRNKFIIPVVEIYPRNTVDITSLSAPENAIGRFANTCFTWTNETGSYEYKAKVLSVPEINTYLDERVNSAEVLFNNVVRGEESMSRFVLNNNVKGCWMVIRLVFPDHPNESVIMFWGKCNRPGEITNNQLPISAVQDLGNFNQTMPFRNYQVLCPLEFARPGGGCLGNETLAEKSVSYQQAVALYGSAGCNKLFSTCVLLDNTRYFQGQKITAVSGQFSYITIEEVVKRVLFWTKRKKISVVKTDNWSSVNQSEGNEVVPLAFGRCQIQGHPFVWADTGNQVRSFQGFCEGKISAFTFVRSRTEGINIISQTEHLGDWGGIGTQSQDTLFNGITGFNSRLAYLELLTDGSSPTQVDDAPLVTAVIRGLEIPVPDPTGVYSLTTWTNNPVHITRFLLTDIRFGRIPTSRIDDSFSLLTAAECETIVEDRTNDEVIVLPSNEYENYGITYRRFRSSGRYSAYKDLTQFDVVEPLGPPEFEEPYVEWYNPFEPYVLPRPQSVLRQKYTFNCALQEKTTVLDFLNKRLLPTFKGFINYGFNGQIQIKTRKKADNAYIRMDAAAHDESVAVSNIAPWRGNYSGYLIIGVSLEHAEIREVTGVQYSTACNGMPITAEYVGTVTATTSGTLSGGSTTTPATAYVDISGSVSANSTVSITLNDGVDAFVIEYTADGIEDIPCFTRMLKEFMNANLQFQEDLYAYIAPNEPHRIWIRCESGYLELNEPLQYEHVEAEEVLRVQAVFENCGELTANWSAQFDNIVADTFTWNNDEQEEINAVEATYTSAIDDFHLTKILPRAAWDTIDLEGELAKEELDLTAVDNYWQAAYLAKSYAIENIDGNLYFSFETGMAAARLELGDVVAVRHDSGDGALNYVPVWVYSLSPNLNDFVVSVGAKLYLSAAHDLRVQPVDALLTTTLNPSLNPDIIPEPIGSNGGLGGGADPVVTEPLRGDPFQPMSVYSPHGRDLV